jgi:hypothetical protein
VWDEAAMQQQRSQSLDVSGHLPLVQQQQLVQRSLSLDSSGHLQQQQQQQDVQLEKAIQEQQVQVQDLSGLQQPEAGNRDAVMGPEQQQHTENKQVMDQEALVRAKASMRSAAAADSCFSSCTSTVPSCLPSGTAGSPLLWSIQGSKIHPMFRQLTPAGQVPLIVQLSVVGALLGTFMLGIVTLSQLGWHILTSTCDL